MQIILAIGIAIPILLLIVPSVYASESNAKRYNDGYSNGSDAGARDSTYNVTCDPNGQFTSDGQHSTAYCSGWAAGYTITWNNLHQTTIQQTQTQTQQQDQKQNQVVHTCIAIKCVITQGGSQGQDQQSNQGNTQP